MTKYFWCFLVLVLVLVLVTAPRAEAGDVTLFGGMHRPGELTLGTAGSSAGQLTDPKNFGVFGVRINRAGGPVGVEHTIAYSPGFLDSDASAFLQSTNILVGIPLLRVRPYGTAGIGFVYAGGSGPASLGTKFAFNYGGGVKVSAAGPIGIRFDVRGYSIRGLESQTLRMLETSVGLLFAF